MSGVATGADSPVPPDSGEASGAVPKRPAPLLNAANVLTVLRIVLVPVFVAALVVSDGTHSGWLLASAVLFAIASITDYWDGRIARAHDLVTPFGAVADPIADKALTGAALIGLSAYALLPWWVTVVILVRELGVTALRFWVIRHGVIAASRGGKLKTLLQIAAIIWYLCPIPDPVDHVGTVVMGAAVLATVVTGGDYLVRALSLRRTGRER
ncbi:CDP-diacylglycerol--glycerol-3-phosphate 3-phosphatidyltransferase [Cryptosporangium aurantiacum]|uniref:CDP-diacylglycerol--glycerol-3-phosphate 3-phosphatidyltransferase n=1 Tax=Cryptosporangium aurantiacum TaxID=134849 RepID=A0A1M7ISF8_9ACTN|nr:CDP-diacylglycerol--glycerol-3-phosphate 3-phosphatidyltransferase [Cryptosporangium aurantiacum]SHM43744.1 CDP-diacylglycerol--glycerol-3-phosphate 3-phosphatidyltransferase [Cryptosporangium aurantiacum]